MNKQIFSISDPKYDRLRRANNNIYDEKGHRFLQYQEPIILSFPASEKRQVQPVYSDGISYDELTERCAKLPLIYGEEEYLAAIIEQEGDVA